MSEKRFYYGIFDDGTEYIEDYKKKEHYFNLDDVEELLNHQQDTIEQLKEEIDEWKKENRELLDKIQEFERIPKSIRELWVE